MIERLDIVGNGFDRHHGIPSDMRDFARFLSQTDRTVYRMVGEYFGVDAVFWSEFETRLAEFDQDQAVDYAAQFLSDEGHGHFEYELQQIGEGLSVRLNRCFTDWVRGLVVPADVDPSLRLGIDPAARFLSFNYTATLERLYGVPRENVLHIHGFIEDPAARLVLGHGWERRPEDSLNFEPDGPESDWRVRAGIEHIDAFFAATFKPTTQLIAQNADFFSSLAGIEEIRILGHGLWDVDAPYIEAVLDAVDLDRVRWTVSTFDDLDERRRRFGAYGIDEVLVTYQPLAAF